MSALKLTFHPAAALQLVKDHQPLAWQRQLYRYDSELLRVVDAKNVSLTKALQHLMNKYSEIATKIYVLASYHHIMTETTKEFNNVTSEIEKYTAQLLAIQTPGQIPIISSAELETLLQFYRGKITSLNARKAQLLSHPEIVNNLEVTEEVIYTNKS